MQLPTGHHSLQAWAAMSSGQQAPSSGAVLAAGHIAHPLFFASVQFFLCSRGQSCPCHAEPVPHSELQRAGGCSLRVQSRKQSQVGMQIAKRRNRAARAEAEGQNGQNGHVEKESDGPTLRPLGLQGSSWGYKAFIWVFLGLQIRSWAEASKASQTHIFRNIRTKHCRGQPCPASCPQDTG